MLDKLLEFVKTTLLFQGVKRIILHQDKDTFENDAEHSYQLAMAAWYIANSDKLNLNVDLVLKYALVHDFVEVHAGDTHFYRSDDQSDKKVAREKLAREKLAKDFPDFTDMHKFIEQYEAREDRESRFVYALDKVLPVINIWLGGGREWKRDEITFDMLMSKKIDKVAISLEIKPYFDNLVTILEKEKRLFHVKSE